MDKFKIVEENAQKNFQEVSYNLKDKGFIQALVQAVKVSDLDYHYKEAIILMAQTWLKIK